MRRWRLVQINGLLGWNLKRRKMFLRVRDLPHVRDLPRAAPVENAAAAAEIERYCNVSNCESFPPVSA